MPEKESLLPGHQDRRRQSMRGAPCGAGHGKEAAMAMPQTALEGIRVLRGGRPHRAGWASALHHAGRRPQVPAGVVKYQAPPAGGARNMVSAGRRSTPRRPRMSRRGHGMGGDTRRGGVLTMAGRAEATRLIDATICKGEVLWAGSMAKSH